MWQTHLSELSAEQKEAEKLRQDSGSFCGQCPEIFKSPRSLQNEYK